MTIEKLLGYSVDQLEAMSNEEMENFFAPMLKHIRPELREKVETPKVGIPKSNSKQSNFDDRLAKLMEAAKERFKQQ